MTLSPTCARILDSNTDGIVTGHAAAMARLRADKLVAPAPDGSGVHRITEAGWQALHEWRRDHEHAPAPHWRTSYPASCRASSTRL
ncbi:hypothetical protein ACWD0A_27590 [Streptomyces sp. NPDC002867]